MIPRDIGLLRVIGSTLMGPLRLLMYLFQNSKQKKLGALETAVAAVVMVSAAGFLRQTAQTATGF